VWTFGQARGERVGVDIDPRLGGLVQAREVVVG
jgi:hypothetical protein